MSAPAPKRIGNADGDVRKLNEFCTNVSVDIYNYIKDLENRLTALQKGSIAGKVSATITDYASKASVVSADQTYIADSAAANAIKRVTMGVISTFINAVNALITTYATKSPVTGADQVYIADSASGNAIKRATLTDVAAVANAVNATITTYAAKSPVAGADQAYIADSAAGNAIKRASLTDIAAVANAVNSTITTYSAKSPVVGADQVYVADSAAGNAIKRATLTDVAAVANAVNATITTYSSKSPVVAADQIYLADSAAGNAIKRAVLSDVATLVDRSNDNPFITPPASANAFDDEFNSGSADLAIRGWTIKNSGGTTLTRSGDISPWDSTGPVGNTYWSRISRSFLLIQIPVSTTVFIFKSVSLSAGDIHFARVGSNYDYNSTGSTNFQEVGLYYNNGSGLPDNNNRLYVSHYETAASMNCDMNQAVGGVNTGTSRAIYSAHDIRGIRYQNGTSFYAFSADSANGQSLSRPVGTLIAATIAYFAITFSTQSGGTLPNIHCIDFARKKTGAGWINE